MEIKEEHDKKNEKKNPLKGCELDKEYLPRIMKTEIYFSTN